MIHVTEYNLYLIGVFFTGVSVGVLIIVIAYLLNKL
jgi:hypothetical protein